LAQQVIEHGVTTFGGSLTAPVIVAIALSDTTLLTMFFRATIDFDSLATASFGTFTFRFYFL